MIVTDFGDLIAERMRIEHRALAARWFERLLDLLPVDARDIFPTESLLDHVPALILEISAYLRHPEEDAIASNTAILEKARELGALRHSQRASLHQLLREYQVLAAILVTFVVEEMEGMGVAPPARDSVHVVSRLHQAVNVLSQATVESFVTLYMQTITEQRERLEQFARMAAHEWREPLSVVQVGVTLLNKSDLDVAQRRRTVELLQRNVAQLVECTHTLESVARLNGADDSPVLQDVSVSTIVEEAARQLREMAAARDVDIRIAENLPRLIVDVGRLELIFVNLLSNAIKYSDPAKPTRYVEVSAPADAAEGQCAIVVRDNGIGIPADAVGAIFERFTRAHTHRDDMTRVAGLGLGLSIVADCVRALGGAIEVHSTEGEGTTFLLTVPPKPK
ncbi:MAG TPA: HAMP domain-containing sensor histidine kinase [Vicinamibacterales bacterium]